MLENLRLQNFRCFDALSIQVPADGAIFVGSNAQGKTSILEALCTLVRLHSPRTNRFSTLTQFATPGFGIAGAPWGMERKVQLKASGLLLKSDGEVCRSRSDYLEGGGLIVWMGNEDLNLVRGPGETRRHFLDFLGVQLDGKYRTAITRYRRALKAKNLLLKEPRLRMPELLAWEDILIEHGTYLMESRARLIETLVPHAAVAQNTISGKEEKLSISYLPGSGPALKDSIFKARKKETMLRQAVIGPHRDDVALRIKSMSAKDYASEGQQRTIALALKIAQGEMLRREKNKIPIYLLDDIFGELDLYRRNALLEQLPTDAQKWITTTHLDWLKVPHPHLQPHILRVADGEIENV